MTQRHHALKCKTFRHDDLAYWICASLSEVHITQLAGVTVLESLGLLTQYTECAKLEVVPVL
jgi:hypothetical protein